jgi:acetoin utilization protein AcuB|tara:strand:+ start:1051 stop:1710 length:660 start_codon:yes stop_codon:yes gene_type:complete
LALIVVDMGRRIATPQKKDNRSSIKVHATKSSSGIDQYNDFSENDPQAQQNNAAQTLAKQHSAAEANRQDPYSIQKQRQAEKEPSQVSLLADIMSKNVITLSPTATVADAWQLFQQYGFQSIPIIDEDNTVLAMLAERAILRGPGIQENINPKNIMTFAAQRVFCFSSDTDIRQATRTLYEYDLDALPIISDQHELLGIVTRTDIIKTVSHYGPLELWA